MGADPNYSNEIGISRKEQEIMRGAFKSKV